MTLQQLELFPEKPSLPGEAPLPYGAVAVPGQRNEGQGQRSPANEPGKQSKKPVLEGLQPKGTSQG